MDLKYEKEAIEEGIKLLNFYAYSLTEIFESQLNRELLDNWKKASLLLQAFTIENKSEIVFPLTINEQIDIITKPICDWGIVHFDKFDGIPEGLIWNNSGEWHLTDVARNLAGDYNPGEGAQFFKELQIHVRSNEIADTYYKTLRKLAIEKPILDEKEYLIEEEKHEENASSRDRLIFKMFLNAEQPSDLLKKIYEEIPPDVIYDNKIYVCPYCGYTLSKKIKCNTMGKEYEEFYCISRKCFERKGKSEVKCININGQMKYYRPRAEIMHSVVIPGRSEILLRDKLTELIKDKSFTVELYPNADETDIKIEFSDGEIWIADVKDWDIPFKLASHLNIRGFAKDKGISYNKAFLVLPDEVRNPYINVLRNNWIDSKLYQIIRVKEFVELVKERADDSEVGV